MSSTNCTTANDISKVYTSKASPPQTTYSQTPAAYPLPETNSPPSTTSSSHNHTAHYIPISQPWSTTPTTTNGAQIYRRSTHSVQASSASPKSTGPHEAPSTITETPMQRWQEESTRQEPWNGISEYMVMPLLTTAAQTGGESALRGDAEGLDEVEGGE